MKPKKVKKQNFYVTQEDEGELFWNNDDGWTVLEGATVFTEVERGIFNLPIGGVWRLLPSLPSH